MAFSDEELAELKSLCPDAASCEEGSQTAFLLPTLPLPPGCTPATADGLLWPHERDGYPNRLFLSARVSKPGQQPNWNATARIAERNWQAYSWNVHRTDLRLAQMVAEHLRALR